MSTDHANANDARGRTLASFASLATFASIFSTSLLRFKRLAFHRLSTWHFQLL